MKELAELGGAEKPEALTVNMKLQREGPQDPMTTLTGSSLTGKKETQETKYGGNREWGVCLCAWVLTFPSLRKSWGRRHGCISFFM